MDAFIVPAELIARLKTDPHGLLSHVAGLPAAEREPLTGLVHMARQAPAYDPWTDDLLIQEFSSPLPARHAAA